MWPFRKTSKLAGSKPSGFVDHDGVYKIRLDPVKFAKKCERNMVVLALLDQRLEEKGLLPRHIAKQKMLLEYAERGEPVPARWLDPSIGTFRADSNGLPAKYPTWENRG